MSTRAGVIFKKDNKDMVRMYNHYDGYPEGLGKDICDFLKQFQIVNGINLDKKEKSIANGYGCLVAQFIKTFKDGAGGLYIEPIDADFYGDYGTEYAYVIECTDYDQISFKCYDTYSKKELYSGNLEDFDNFLSTYGQEDE